MIVDKTSMFCDLAFSRKRKMAAAIDNDPPYGVTTPPPEPDLTPDSVQMSWWTDVIDAHELADVIRNQCDEKVLLIDCRSFIEFNQSNIVNSINVCCNKIVKRRLQQNKLKIQDFLSSTCHIEIDNAYTIVIYDGTTTDASTLPNDNIVTILGNKCSKAFLRVRILYGGFLEFQSHHPSLLETKTKTPHQQATASLSQPCMPVTNIGPTKILPYLFLGSMKDALNADLAKANGITYVLNVSMTCPKPNHIQDGHFLRIPVNDNYNEKLLPYFHEAFQFIDKVRESGGCVLVHCLAGVSRSPTLAIAYIMRCYHMVSEDAYRYVKEKRITISPNFNFLGQLLEYEKQMDKEDSSHFTGSKRRCIDDLRAELSTPGSPIATPRFPKSSSLDSNLNTSKGMKAHSPTTALSKLKFEHGLNSVAAQGANSPTAAFAKLRFGTILEGGSITQTPISSSGTEEPEYMQCYSSDTIHQNMSAENTPCDSAGTPRSISLHLLNTNCNNSNISNTDSRSPSPNSLRPLRPMSLSLNCVDDLSTNTKLTQKRPQSLGVNILQDAKVEERTVSNTTEMVTTMCEATPPSETLGVEVSTVSVITPSPESFKHPEQVDITPTTELVFREKSPSQKYKHRPRSVTLVENPPKERVSTPSTPTADYLTSPHTVPKNLDRLSSYEVESKSRSLEDIIHIPDNITTGQSTGSISSAGSRSSLHGSLEVIKVL